MQLIDHFVRAVLTALISSGSFAFTWLGIYREFYRDPRLDVQFYSAMNYFSAVAVFFTLICSSRTHLVKEITTEGCSLPADLVAEIRSYQAKVDEIVNAVVNGSHSKEVWQELADFTDDFGNRIAGSENLENAIDYMVKRSQWHNVDVHTEPVSVPHWVR